MTIRWRLFTGFTILILIFIAVFFINQRLSEQVITNTSYLNNSEMVIRNSNKLHKEMIEMQSGFRGFLLTDQESFLASYYEGLKKIPDLYKEQKNLLATPEQIQKLDNINRLHHEWIDYADSLILAKKDASTGTDLRYKRLFNSKLKMEVGKKLNDQIRDQFIQFDDQEYALRQKRRSTLFGSIDSTKKVSAGLMIAAILIALLTSLFIIRTITSRISKMVLLSERIAKGEFITLSDLGEDELSKLVSSLNRMSETLSHNFLELNKKNKELDEFAYVVSHDLKAPLRGITNILDWLEEDHHQEITPKVKEKLEIVKGRAHRLEKMINGLLAYARIGKTSQTPELILLPQLLDDLTSMLSDKHSIVLKEGIPDTMYGDKLHLEQVFANLISNAVKHNASPQKVISIHGQETAQVYRFSITDNGPGIQNDYFDKIFLIFQTLQERDAFESTGVGLAIVKKIVEDQKGTIHVKSDPGKGSTFTFTWPKIFTADEKSVID